MDRQDTQARPAQTSPAITVEAKDISHMTAQRRVQVKGELRGGKALEKAPRVHALDVEETIGGTSAPKVEPVREESLEEERLATPKGDTPRAREKDSTTWENPVQKKTRGRDHRA